MPSHHLQIRIDAADCRFVSTRGLAGASQTSRWSVAGVVCPDFLLQSCGEALQHIRTPERRPPHKPQTGNRAGGEAERLSVSDRFITLATSHLKARIAGGLDVVSNQYGQYFHSRALNSKSPGIAVFNARNGTTVTPRVF